MKLHDWSMTGIFKVIVEIHVYNLIHYNEKSEVNLYYVAIYEEIGLGPNELDKCLKT